jgi:hypothetical protein
LIVMVPFGFKVLVGNGPLFGRPVEGQLPEEKRFGAAGGGKARVIDIARPMATATAAAE